MAAGTRHGRAYAPHAVELVIYCADVGSVKSGSFGWARTSTLTDEIERGVGGGTEMLQLVEMLARDLGDGRPVALGFECPLYVPVRENPLELLEQRAGEAGRPWSAGAGAQVLTIGVAQVAWVLTELHREQPNVPCYVDWRQFTAAGGGLFLWEAFVTGQAKAKNKTHIGDATVAVEALREALPDPTRANAVTAERPLSLLGAALLWSGWSDDTSLLAMPCLVIKAQAAAALAATPTARAAQTAGT